MIPTPPPPSRATNVVVVAYLITCTAWPCSLCVYQTNRWTLESERLQSVHWALSLTVRDIEVRHDGGRARPGRSSRYGQSKEPPSTLSQPLSLYSLLISLLVGDIAPREGIPKAEKRRLEAVRLLPQQPPHVIPSFSFCVR